MYSDTSLEVPLRWEGVSWRGWELLYGRWQRLSEICALLLFVLLLPMVCGEGRGLLGPVAVIEEA